MTQAFDIIMGIPHLRDSLRFELVPFLQRVHDHIMKSRGTPAAEAPYMLGGGKCQSRKTSVWPPCRPCANPSLACSLYSLYTHPPRSMSLVCRPLKLCMFIMGRLLGVSTILLTTGTSGRNDLFNKFTSLLQSSDLPSPHAYVSPGTEFVYGIGDQTPLPQLMRASSEQVRASTFVLRSGSVGTVGKQAWACEQLLEGACLVVNHSCQVRIVCVCAWPGPFPSALIILIHATCRRCKGPNKWCFWLKALQVDASGPSSSCWSWTRRMISTGRKQASETAPTTGSIRWLRH